MAEHSYRLDVSSFLSTLNALRRDAVAANSYRDPEISILINEHDYFRMQRDMPDVVSSAYPIRIQSFFGMRLVVTNLVDEGEVFFVSHAIPTQIIKLPETEISLKSKRDNAPGLGGKAPDNSPMLGGDRRQTP